MKSRVKFVIAIVFIAVGASAQVAKLRTEDMMDAVFDMKKAAGAADSLASDGMKYCRWGYAELDGSDLDVAISRYLLKHGSQVPDDIAASNLWRVSLIARDIANQSATGASMCYLQLRLSDEARNVGLRAASLSTKLLIARTKFNEFAYERTKWQEAQTDSSHKDAKGESLGSVPTKDILAAAIEMKDAAEIESKLAARSRKTPGCLQSNSPTQIDWSDLDKIIDYMTRVANSPHRAIPAANVWGVAIQAEAAQLSILITQQSCLPYAGEKKEARNLASDATAAYGRLRRAIADFEALALRQTQSEEQETALKNQVVQEQ